MDTRPWRAGGATALIAGTAATCVWAWPVSDRLPVAVVGVTVPVLGLVGITVARSVPGWQRLSWVAVGVALSLWAAALVGVLLGWPGWLTWGVLRGAGYLTVGLGLAVAPALRRNWRDWGPLLMDGWLLAGSTLLVCWVALDLTGSPVAETARSLPPPLLWTGLDVLAATVVGGLTVRAAPHARVPSAMVALSALVAVAADVSWAATGRDEVGVVLWATMISTLGLATFAPVTELWATSVADPEDLQVARLTHLAVVPGLLAAAVAPNPDPLTVGVAVSLLFVLGTAMLLSSLEKRTLWRRTREQAHRLDTVLRESMDAIVRLTTGGQIEYANPAAAEVFDRPLHALVGNRAVDLLHPVDLADVRRLFRELAPDEDAVRVVARTRRRDGSWRHVEATVSRADTQGGYVVIARDVEERIRLEAELRREAATDALTGLLNRHAFLTALEGALRAGDAAVLYLDLDEFKSVNDTRGHEAGDELLIRVAWIIASVAGPDRRVARLGGDEFAVLVSSPEPEVPGVAESLAIELVGRLAGERALGSRSVSIGIAVGRGQPAEEVLGNADLAMYEAKVTGGGRCTTFDPDMRRRVLARSRLRDDLESVIEAGGLDLDLQPIVDLPTGRWVGFEALVRWPDGDRRRSPADFLPLAEETGLIVPLGTWVLREALAWLATWPDEDAGVSVNVTGRQVAEPGFADVVREALRTSGVVPSRLTLEITEQTAVEDLGRAGDVLQPLRGLGVHVALDDFGTGYSSLGYLAQLPVDELKIDRRFVSGLGQRAEDDALVRVVLALAGDLGLRVVAEGVESVEQAAILREYECPLAQGYLFARPIPHSDLRPRIASGSAEGAVPGRRSPRAGASVPSVSG